MNKSVNKSEKYIGFDPLINDDSEFLILGSFPSVKSRENNFYYGHPQNRFWKMLASIFHEDLPKSIEEKKVLCKKHKIALWDVIIESDIKDSSDFNLEKSNYKICNLNNLLKKYKKIRTIICNGKLSYKLFIKFFNIPIDVFCLPSTSPANPRFNINEWKNVLLK